MESPVTIIKSNLSPKKIIGTVVGLWFAFLVLDALGVTGAVLYPFTWLKTKFGKGPAA